MIMGSMNMESTENKVIIASRWRTPDGTLLESKHTHDYVGHTDTVSGEYYFVDGGTSYVRMSQNKVPMSNCCVYSTDPIEAVRKYFRRGTFDKDGNRLWVLLKNLSDGHVQNIIKDIVNSGGKLTDPIAVQYVRELAYRFDYSDHVEEHDYTPADEEK